MESGLENVSGERKGARACGAALGGAMVMSERRRTGRRRAGPFFRIIQTLESNAH
jgi:hypothetical protein